MDFEDFLECLEYDAFLNLDYDLERTDSYVSAGEIEPYEENLWIDWSLVR